MGSEIDDPGPNRHYIAGSDHQLLTGIREIVDQKDDGTVGISYYVRQSAGVRRFGMVVCRMGLLHPKPPICVSVL